MKKVLIPTKLDNVARQTLLANGSYLVVQDEKAPLSELAAAHPDAYALIVRGEEVSAALIDSLPALKVIVRAGAGYNTIDVKYARRKGIDVMTTPGANSNAVAEQVVAMMLADARHLVAADASCRRGEWEKRKFMGRELAGKTVGIVGLGNIGQLVARRLAGFECRLLGHDPVISPERAREMDVELVSLDTLLAESDCVTLHIPENQETRGLFGETLLAKMKQGATLVNCARAGIVDEAALRAAKKARGLRFLNDVYPRDEPGPKSVADVADLMLPHLGANTFEANAKAAQRAAEELIEYDFRGVTSYVVNRDIPEGLDRAFCQLANTLARLARLLVGRTTPLKLIETSVYGDLRKYADWLLVPMTAGLCDDFEPWMEPAAARRHLAGRGIDFVNREVDAHKRYGNSITIDLTAAADGGGLRQVSVRGTLAEGIEMVSRINEFDKLYFEPVGHAVMFLYEDRPGVLGAVGHSLAQAGINIEDVRNPHDVRTNRSLAIMKINKAAPEDLVRRISAEISALSAFSTYL
jgi:D-3-phosphoglycerate dehydrogenase